MANEVMHRADVTSGTLRFTIRNNSGQMWSTPATADFVTLVAANWANYIITMTESEVGASYYYTGTFPAIAGNMIAGWYTVDIFSGTAISSTLIGTQYGYWDGTNFHLDAANVKEVASVTQTGGDLYPAIQAIGIIGTRVGYAPSTVVRTVGDIDGGVAAATSAHDDSYFDTGEVAVIGLSVLATVTTSTITQIPAMLHVTGYYDGSATHQIDVQIYNYVANAFETVGVMLNRTSAFDYTFPMSLDNQETAANGGTDTGKMEVKFLHSAATYNATHVLRLDYISFDKQVTDSETASSIAAIKAQTDQLQFILGHVDATTAALSTTVATADTTTSFTLTAGLAANDAYNGQMISIQDADDGHEEVRRITDYTSGRVVTVDRAFGFTPSANDPALILAYYESGADTAGTTELLTRVREPSTNDQQIAREATGTSGTVWHIAYSVSETMGNDALSWATADLTAGVGVKTDCEVATNPTLAAGDLVQIGAGTFALGSKAITTVAGTKIAGAGRDITRITSTEGSIFAENIIVLSSNTEVSDVTIEALSTAGKPIGTSALFTNAVIRRVRTQGDYDGLWVSQDSACTCSVYDSEFEGKYDSVAMFGAGNHVVQMFNCIIKTVGPSLQAANNPSHGAWCSTGTLWLWNCNVHCQDGNAGYPTVGLCAYGTANIYMFGGSIRTSNAANTDLAVENSGTGKIVLIGVDYDRTKTSNTNTGSIIDIPAHSLDSNGLTIQAAADAALVANNLDHLALTATGIPTLEAGTYLDQARSDGTAVYDRTTDSQQAIRDRGDAAWVTATTTAASNMPADGDFLSTAQKSSLTAIEADVTGLDGATPATLATALLDLANGVETGATMRQALRRIAAVLSGKVSGAGTGTNVFVGMDGLTKRVKVTADSDGNRSAVQYDPA